MNDETNPQNVPTLVNQRSGAPAPAGRGLAWKLLGGSWHDNCPRKIENNCWQVQSKSVVCPC